MSLFADLKEVFTPYAQRIKAIGTQVNGVSEELESFENRILVGESEYTDGYSQGYWNGTSGIYTYSKTCCNTVPIVMSETDSVEIEPNGLYIYIQDGESGTLTGFSALYDDESLSTASYRTAQKIVIPAGTARKLYFRIGKSTSPDTAIVPSEVDIEVKTIYQDSDHKADAGIVKVNLCHRIEKGGLAWANGAEQASNDIYRTGFIEVEPSEIYEVYSNRNLLADVQYVFEYNVNKVCTGFVTMKKTWFMTASTTKYIRVRTFAAGSFYDLPDFDTFVIEVDKYYRKNAFNTEVIDNGVDEFSVLARQKDTIPKVQACCRYGVPQGGTPNYYKQFCMLVTSDLHGSAPALLAAIEYLNSMDCIDCGISLGDMQSGDFGSSDATWYPYCVGKSEKQFFTVIGNHDTGESNTPAKAGSMAQIFERFIQSTASKIGIEGLATTYYKKDFSDYGISLIVLNTFDLPDTKSGDNYVVARNMYNCFSQAQITWFISALASVPAGYHLIIAKHDQQSQTTPIDDIWTQPGRVQGGCNPVYAGTMIPDIVNAWINGTTLSQSYAPLAFEGTCPTITVDADFTSRGTGAFVGYIQGHQHCDIHSTDQTYTDQHQLAFATTANDYYQSHGNDTPRVRGEKTDECFTVIAVDKEHRLLKAVRVGSAVSTYMVDRTLFKYTY